MTTCTTCKLDIEYWTGAGGDGWWIDRGGNAFCRGNHGLYHKPAEREAGHR